MLFNIILKKPKDEIKNSHALKVMDQTVDKNGIQEKIFFVVCPAWSITWRWKSAVGLVVRTTSRRQGCLRWRGIWRKPAAKSRSDEQELDKRLTWGRRVFHTKQGPTLHKPHTVDLADIWDEGYRSYPGRSVWYAQVEDELPPWVTYFERFSWTFRCLFKSCTDWTYWKDRLGKDLTFSEIDEINLETHVEQPIHVFGTT